MVDPVICERRSVRIAEIPEGHEVVGKWSCTDKAAILITISRSWVLCNHMLPDKSMTVPPSTSPPHPTV